LAAAAHGLASKGPFESGAALAEKAGLPADSLPDLLKALGFRSVRTEAGDPAFARGRPRRRPADAKRRRADAPPIRPDSPFAALKDLARG
ncbi:MAG: hypothetical protein RIM80_18315, partial [Alphaproteobacteria bacterium]